MGSRNMTNADSPMRTCSIEGCDKKQLAMGWCAKHYSRWRRHGDPHHVEYQHREQGKPVDMEYICSQCVIDEHGCWIWQMHRAGGYGHININGKDLRVHRVVWEFENGPIPEGLHVLHNCYRGKHGCCNPDHLRLGTHKENMNDHDCTGDRNGMARVPDDIVVDIVKRYRRGETQRALARELTALGYPTSNATVSLWCSNTNRVKNLEEVAIQ